MIKDMGVIFLNKLSFITIHMISTDEKSVYREPFFDKWIEINNVECI